MPRPLLRCPSPWAVRPQSIPSSKQGKPPGATDQSYIGSCAAMAPSG
jgi:hypothetical protein